MKYVKGWYLPDTDTHFENYIEDGGYQTIHRNTILNHIIMNKHILKNCIDVGSHIGFWSKDFTKLFNHTYAFEPIPQVRECYEKNITKSNYTLYPYGLGREEKKIKVLYDPKETGNTHANDKGNVNVEIKTLDSFNLEDIDYIKIDAEGHELDVCRGGINYIKEHKPFVHVEVKDKVMRRHGIGLPDVIEFFNDVLDYRRKFAIKSEMVFGPNE